MTEDQINLVRSMRERSCKAGQSWTGLDSDSYHGHTDCDLYRRAANEIERLVRMSEEMMKVINDREIEIIKLQNVK